MSNLKYPVTGSGRNIYDAETDTVFQNPSARPASEAEIAQEATGFTNPDLHRRIDPQEVDTASTGEVAPRDYQLEISGVNSYRTTTLHFHDDECEGDVVHYREVEQADGTKIKEPIEIP